MDVDSSTEQTGTIHRYRARGVLGMSGINYWGPPALLLIAILGLWQLIVVIGHVPNYLIASPSAMFGAVGSNFGLLTSELWPTLTEVLIGFMCSVLVGIPISIAVVYSRRIGQALYPLVVASQIIPKVAIAPVFVILVGNGLLPKVLVVFLISFFPIVVSTVLGLRSVDPEMMEMVYSMGASKPKAFVKVRFPFALPIIFSGVKIAMTLAVVGAIVAEFVGSSQGLGYLILDATGQVNTSLVYADLLFMTVMGIILYGSLEILEALLLRGRRISASSNIAGLRL